MEKLGYDQSSVHFLNSVYMPDTLKILIFIQVDREPKMNGGFQVLGSSIWGLNRLEMVCRC